MWRLPGLGSRPACICFVKWSCVLERFYIIIVVVIVVVSGTADLSSWISESLQSHRSSAAYWQCQGKRNRHRLCLILQYKEINSYIASLMSFAEVSSVGRAADIRAGCCCQSVSIQREARVARRRGHHSSRTHPRHCGCVIHQRRLTPPRGAKNRYTVL